MPSLTLLLLFTTPVICLPFKAYNQRQDGEFNVHAQLDNFVIILVPTSGINWVDIAAKARPYKQGSGNFLQLFSRTPSLSPYKVDIDKSNIPLDKVSEDAGENETFDPQIREDNMQPVIAQSQAVQLNGGSGGNTYNNEVTKENNSVNEGSKLSDDKEEKSPSEKVEESKDANQEKEEDTKDSTGSKLAFSSTVTAQLELTPEKQIPEAPSLAAVQQTPPVQEQNNVIIGKALADKNARFLNTIDEKKLKILQSGVEVCSPDQRRTPSGECVNMPTRQR